MVCSNMLFDLAKENSTVQNYDTESLRFCQGGKFDLGRVTMFRHLWLMITCLVCGSPVHLWSSPFMSICSAYLLLGALCSCPISADLGCLASSRWQQHSYKL